MLLGHDLLWIDHYVKDAFILYVYNIGVRKMFALMVRFKLTFHTKNLHYNKLTYIQLQLPGFNFIHLNFWSLFSLIFIHRITAAELSH